MKNVMKLFAMILVFTMLAALMAGCSGKTVDEPAPAADGAAEAVEDRKSVV